MQLENHLDWFEITIPREKHQLGVSYPKGWTKNHTEGKPLNGYNACTQYADGRLEMLHTGLVGMGIHVTLTGKPLQVLCPTRESEVEMIEHFQAQGAKVSRLDCAVDVFDFPLDWEELWAICDAKDFECRLRGEPLIMHSKTEGDTVYFGKFKSTAATRIYDKAKEQRIKDKQWVRIETMFRHGRATSAAKNYAEGGSISGLIAGHLRIPKLDWWRTVMTQEPIKTRANRITSDNRQEWLLKSVAPALAKEIDLCGAEFWNKFRDAVWEKVSSDVLDN